MKTLTHQLTLEDLQAILKTAQIEVDDFSTMIDYDNEGLKLYAYIDNGLLPDTKQRKLEDLECELYGEWYELSFKQKELIRIHLISEMNRFFEEQEDNDAIVYNRADELAELQSDK